MKLEICAINISSAMAAGENGADRIELCDNIVEGGTTPGPAMIKMAASRLTIPVNVMIRPRGGDFIYSDIEFEIMKQDVEYCKSVGVNGIVTGILTREGRVDVERTRLLVKLAEPMEVTFHRAFDLCNEPFEALEDIIDTGAVRLLTSGMEHSAREGRELIKQLVQKSAGRLIIMAGGGINPKNVEKLIDYTGITEVHMSAKDKVFTGTHYSYGKVNLSGGDFARNNYYYSSNPQIIAETAKILKR